MKAFASVTKFLGLGKGSKGGLSSKTPIRLPDLTNSVLDCLSLCINELDDSGYDKGLYNKDGDLTEIGILQQHILDGTLTEEILSSISNPLSVASSIKNVLSLHAPLLTYDLYQTFANRDADIKSVLQQLPTENFRFLKEFSVHLQNVVNSKENSISLNNLVATLGPEILRPISISVDEVDENDSVSRVQQRILTMMILQADNLFDPNSDNNISKSQHDSSHHNDDNESVPSSPALEGRHSQHENVSDHSVADRSVKVTFPRSRELPTEDELRRYFSIFGHIVQAGIRGNHALILYSTNQEAQECMEQWSDVLPDGYKVKAVGDPSRPSVHTTASQESLNQTAATALKEVTAANPLDQSNHRQNSDKFESPLASASMSTPTPTASPRRRPISQVVAKAVKGDLTEEEEEDSDYDWDEQKKSSNKTTTSVHGISNGSVHNNPVTTNLSSKSPLTTTAAADRRPTSNSKAPSSSSLLISQDSKISDLDEFGVIGSSTPSPLGKTESKSDSQKGPQQSPSNRNREEARNTNMSNHPSDGLKGSSATVSASASQTKDTVQHTGNLAGSSIGTQAGASVSEPVRWPSAKRVDKSTNDRDVDSQTRLPVPGQQVQDVKRGDRGSSEASRTMAMGQESLSNMTFFAKASNSPEAVHIRRNRSESAGPDDMIFGTKRTPDLFIDIPSYDFSDSQKSFFTQSLDVNDRNQAATTSSTQISYSLSLPDHLKQQDTNEQSLATEMDDGEQDDKILKLSHALLSNITSTTTRNDTGAVRVLDTNKTPLLSQTLVQNPPFHLSSAAAVPNHPYGDYAYEIPVVTHLDYRRMQPSHRYEQAHETPGKHMEYAIQIPAERDDAAVNRGERGIVQSDEMSKGVGASGHNDMVSNHHHSTQTRANTGLAPSSFRHQTGDRSTPNDSEGAWSVSSDNPLLRRIRQLEADLKNQKEEAQNRGQEMSQWEAYWTDQITALRLQCQEAQREAKEGREATRKLRTELASKDAEMAAAMASLEFAERSVDSAKATAEREALTTVLSLRRLVALLEQQRNAAMETTKSLSIEVKELRELHSQSTQESLHWRTRAIAAEQELNSLASRLAAPASSRINGEPIEIKVAAGVSLMEPQGQKQGPSEALQSTLVQVEDERKASEEGIKIPPSAQESVKFDADQRKPWELALPAKTTAREETENYLRSRRHRVSYGLLDQAYGPQGEDPFDMANPMYSAATLRKGQGHSKTDNPAHTSSVPTNNSSATSQTRQLENFVEQGWESEEPVFAYDTQEFPNTTSNYRNSQKESYRDNSRSRTQSMSNNLSRDLSQSRKQLEQMVGRDVNESRNPEFQHEPVDPSRTDDEFPFYKSEGSVQHHRHYPSYLRSESAGGYTTQKSLQSWSSGPFPETRQYSDSFQLSGYNNKVKGSKPYASANQSSFQPKSTKLQDWYYKSFR